MNKQLNVHMVESNSNTTHWNLCGNLNLKSGDWNTLSSDDQCESSFLKPIAKFNFGLVTDNDFLQRGVLLTDNHSLCNNFKINQSFSDHLALSCQVAFENKTEQINLNRNFIHKAVSESLHLFFLNNRCNCSNDANRMLETFY